jgi:hypothetical protein
VLQYLALRSADDWYRQRLDTPSGDFARIANEWPDRDKSIEGWQQLSSCTSFRDGTRTGHPQTRQAGCPTLLRQWLGGIPAFLLPTIVHQNCYSSVSY